MMIVKSAAELRTAIANAKREALKDAQACGCKRIFPRDTNLATTDSRGQCDPRVEAEGPGFDGRWESVVELVQEVERSYPNVTSVYISGGFDGAESKAFYEACDYEPLIGEWTVEVWERKPSENRT